jgi:hypothetical protein
MNDQLEQAIAGVQAAAARPVRIEIPLANGRSAGIVLPGDTSDAELLGMVAIVAVEVRKVLLRRRQSPSRLVVPS